MGCPAGIGPEIILKYFCSRTATDRSHPPVVIGDLGVLVRCGEELRLPAPVRRWQPDTAIEQGTIPVLEASTIGSPGWGKPTVETGRAMAAYIIKAVELCLNKSLSGIVTCPIAKDTLQAAGYPYPGHTEMLAQLTGTTNYAMMMAGDRLRVTLATIHCRYTQVVHQLSEEEILRIIMLTNDTLYHDFGIRAPRIGVAGLNPHCGESGLFGDEEICTIAPAVSKAQVSGINASGPHPPDTIFVQAANGQYDCVVCMYHDQGLIPFKLLHFKDGVNVTLGLPIVRTSVDHGTAYDIAGKGCADAASLAAAIRMADQICNNRNSARSANKP